MNVKQIKITVCFINRDRHEPQIAGEEKSHYSEKYLVVIVITKIRFR